LEACPNYSQTKAYESAASLFVQNKAREVVSDLSDQKPHDIQDSHQLRLIDLCNLVPRRTIPGLWFVDL
jgi:hypothetical protein